MYPIPANATRIRYLESTGTQYIDTGVVPDASTEVDAVFETFDVTTGRQLFGSRNSATGGIFAMQLQTASVATMRAGYGGVYYSTTGVASGRQIAHMDNSGASLGSASIAYSNALGVPLYPMFVLAINNGGVANIGSTRLRVSAFAISQSGVLVRSFVPVRVGSGSSAVGYLYDRVSGTLFGNAADNNAGFTAECLGPDTFQQGVVPTRMCVMGVRKKKVWPTPLYTGVSLVGSSVQNNAGILSGFTSSSYAKMPFYWTAGATQIEAVIKIHFAQTGSAQGIWGCVGSTNAFTPFYYNGPNGPLGSYLSTTGNSWQASPNGDAGTPRVAWNNSSPLATGDYILREVYESGTVKTGRWSNGAWTTETSNSFGTIYGASNLVPQLGTNRGQNNPFLGTIDLNYTYLYRDGELWWEGAAGAYKNVKTTYPD